MLLSFFNCCYQNLSKTYFAAKNPQRPVLAAGIWRKFTHVPTQVSRESCARVTALGHLVQEHTGENTKEYFRDKDYFPAWLHTNYQEIESKRG